jgi:hypothetical protein
MTTGDQGAGIADRGLGTTDVIECGCRRPDRSGWRANAGARPCCNCRSTACIAGRAHQPDERSRCSPVASEPAPAAVVSHRYPALNRQHARAGAVGGDDGCYRRSWRTPPRRRPRRSRRLPEAAVASHAFPSTAGRPRRMPVRCRVARPAGSSRERQGRAPEMSAAPARPSRRVAGPPSWLGDWAVRGPRAAPGPPGGGQVEVRDRVEDLRRWRPKHSRNGDLVVPGRHERVEEQRLGHGCLLVSSSSITSGHVTSHSPRLSCGSRLAWTWTGRWAGRRVWPWPTADGRMAPAFAAHLPGVGANVLPRRA